MARPKINDSEKRIVQVNIRLTTGENDKVVELSKASGLSPANWIRMKIFTGKFPPIRMSPLDTAVYLELKKIGVNLNQVTHKINLGEFPKMYLVHQLELTRMLREIIKRLTDDGQPDQG